MSAPYPPRATSSGAEGADSLWRYQKDLVAAARKRDGAAAQSVSDASLDNATQRIRALLADGADAVPAFTPA